MTRSLPRLAASVLLAALVMGTGCGPDPIAPRPPALAPILTGNATVATDVTEQIRTLVKQHKNFEPRDRREFRIQEIVQLDVRQPFADAAKVYSFEGIGIRDNAQYHFMGTLSEGASEPFLAMVVSPLPGLSAPGEVGEDVVGRIAGRVHQTFGQMVRIQGMDTTPIAVSTPNGVTAFTARIDVDARPVLAQGYYYAADKTISIMRSNLD